MRKQTKLVAVLSAASLMAIGASMMSYAKGWTEEDGEWVYLDSDGDRVTEEWKKSGSNYYWLDEDGIMATSTLVEDDDDVYYVDETGVRVKNQWVCVDNEEDEEVDGKEVDVLWYYMGSSGKAYAASDKEFKVSTINGKKYMFDEDGRMVSGWTEYDGNMYYLGEENEGWAHTGWQYLELDEDIHAGDYDYDEGWFNFKSSGAMRKNGRAYLSGAYYAFDEYGVMMTDWYVATGSNKITASPGNTLFGYEDGAQRSGWIYAYSEKDMEGDQEWYYLVKGNKNAAFNGNGEEAGGIGDVQKYKEGHTLDGSVKEDVAAKVINGKTYIFNNEGKMLTGVFEITNGMVRSGSSNLENGIYYFNKSGGSVQGQMETGRTTITYDGEDYTYYFQSSGKAYTMLEKDGSLYDAYGVRVEAEDGNKYEVVDLSDLINAKTNAQEYVTIDDVKYTAGSVVASSTGKLKKSGTVTVNDVKYEVKDYLVTKAYDKDDDDKNDLGASMYEAAVAYTEE